MLMWKGGPHIGSAVTSGPLLFLLLFMNGRRLDEMCVVTVSARRARRHASVWNRRTSANHAAGPAAGAGD